MIVFFKKFSFGVYYIFRKIFGPKQFKGVKVILYHNICRTDFKRHIAYLNANYKIISLEEMIRCFEENIKLNNTFVITFDDGLKTNFDLLDVIKIYKIRPTIFITTNLINTNKSFWFNGLSQKKLLSLLSIDNCRRKELLDNKKTKNREVLNNVELTEMNPYVNFEPHTLSHPSLKQCSNDELNSEIIGSCDYIKSVTGKKAQSFAPPFGYFDNRVLNVLKNQKIKCNLTLKPGVNFSANDLYNIKRIGIPSVCDNMEFISRIDGYWDSIRRIKFLKSYSSFYNQYDE